MSSHSNQQTNQSSSFRHDAIRLSTRFITFKIRSQRQSSRLPTSPILINLLSGATIWITKRKKKSITRTAVSFLFNCRIRWKSHEWRDDKIINYIKSTQGEKLELLVCAQTKDTQRIQAYFARWKCRSQWQRRVISKERSMNFMSWQR